MQVSFVSVPQSTHLAVFPTSQQSCPALQGTSAQQAQQTRQNALWAPSVQVWATRIATIACCAHQASTAIPPGFPCPQVTVLLDTTVHATIPARRPQEESQLRQFPHQSSLAVSRWGEMSVLQATRVLSARRCQHPVFLGRTIRPWAKLAAWSAKQATFAKMQLLHSH